MKNIGTYSCSYFLLKKMHNMLNGFKLSQCDNRTISWENTQALFPCAYLLFLNNSEYLFPCILILIGLVHGCIADIKQIADRMFSVMAAFWLQNSPKAIF